VSDQEAVTKGVEVLELLIEDYRLAGEPLPIPRDSLDRVA
jgi:predicted RNase H-like HicB family nuclease